MWVNVTINVINVTIITIYSNAIPCIRVKWGAGLNRLQDSSDFKNSTMFCLENDRHLSWQF